MDILLQDLRYALRALRRTPTFTVAAVLTLALGIGATTTIFSVVQAVLLRPLPYPRPDEIVVLWETVRRDAVEQRSVSYPNFEDWRDQAESFAAMAAVSTEGLTLTGTELAERLTGEFVSASYFGVLGIRAAVGRAIGAADDIPGAEPVAVISHDLWQRLHGGAHGVVGSTMTLNGRSTTIIGIMPEGFHGLSDAAEVWVPFANPPGVADYLETLRSRQSRWHEVVARLAPGSSVERAQRELDTVSRRLEAEHPEANRDRGALVVPLSEELFGGMRRGLLVLLGAVGFVLLIACVNTANLLLVRAAGREREIAIRAALGANRFRTARQLLVESMVLALAGGAIGAVLATWALDLLALLNPVDLPSFARPRVDGGALAVTLLISVATGLLFGLVPAFAASEPRLQEGLKAGARGSTSHGAARRIRGILVAAELALAVVLLTGAGLMLRSLQSIARFDPGFRPDELVSVRLEVPRGEYDAAQAVALGSRLVEQVEAIPGVRSAALSSDVPLSGASSATIVRIEGRDDATQGDGIRIYRHRIGPGLLQTLGTTLVRGRDFTAQDVDQGQAVGVVLVSETMARRFWPGGDPIGQRLQMGRSTLLEIIGVVGDVKHRALLEAETADPDMYLPLAQFPSSSFSLIVRARGEPEALVGAVRREVQAIDRDIPVFAVATMRDELRAETAEARFQTSLLAGFAALALVLAAVGVYGVMAYAVSQRTRELGVRLALGANRGDIVRLVVGQGARLALLGVAVGVSAGMATTRVLSGLLVGIEPTDPLTFACATAALLAVALLASYLPARRAARVDPTVALRGD